MPPFYFAQYRVALGSNPGSLLLILDRHETRMVRTQTPHQVRNANGQTEVITDLSKPVEPRQADFA
jgi:hypothetical protein